jgi:hypothetical protein
MNSIILLCFERLLFNQVCLICKVSLATFVFEVIIIIQAPINKCKASLFSISLTARTLIPERVTSSKSLMIFLTISKKSPHSKSVAHFRMISFCLHNKKHTNSGESTFPPVCSSSILTALLIYNLAISSNSKITTTNTIKFIYKSKDKPLNKTILTPLICKNCLKNLDFRTRM